MITYRRDYSKFFYLCFPNKTSIIMTQSVDRESSQRYDTNNINAIGNVTTFLKG